MSGDEDARNREEFAGEANLLDEVAILQDHVARIASSIRTNDENTMIPEKRYIANSTTRPDLTLPHALGCEQEAEDREVDREQEDRLDQHPEHAEEAAAKPPEQIPAKEVREDRGVARDDASGTRRSGEGASASPAVRSPRRGYGSLTWSREGGLSGALRRRQAGGGEFYLCAIGRWADATQVALAPGYGACRPASAECRHLRFVDSAYPDLAGSDPVGAGGRKATCITRRNCDSITRSWEWNSQSLSSGRMFLLVSSTVSTSA